MSWQIRTWMLQVILLPFYLLLRWGFKKSLLKTFDGIKICDLASAGESEEQFFCSYVIKALKFIKEHDPKRYRRVQRHLAYIVNCRVLASGNYSHSLRECDLNFSSFKWLKAEWEEEWKVFELARLIIHEATHGVMCVRNIPYDKKYRLRVERICHQEEVRFARRARPDYDMREYDENWHQEYYRKTIQQRMIEVYKNCFSAQ